MKELGIDRMLKAIFLEYTTLKTEIQNRSGIQSTILQIHITSLTLIIGAMFTQAFGIWLIFLIPIATSLFGLWWIDSALVINEIGAYIRDSIEPRVSKLLKKEKVLYWEGNFKIGVVEPDVIRTKRFDWLVFITFAVPSIISLLFSITIIISGILLHKIELSSFFISGPIMTVYTGTTELAVYSLFIINLLFFSLFISAYLHRLKVNQKTCEVINSE